MSASSNTCLAEVPIGGTGGAVWNRLHSEREDVCEAMLKQSSLFSELGMDAQRDVSAANWHRELLQARLSKIDDALDRLMSGSYGNCCKCGRWIEDTKLDFDPAIAFCPGCWESKQNQMRTSELIGGADQRLNAATSGVFVRQQISNLPLDGLSLQTLVPFDTILVRTLNSEYRILLLDSKTGRSLVEGGPHFLEPVDAVVYGSKSGGSTFKVGWIGIGLRIEMWVKDHLVSTSPVQSVRVEHHTSTESERAMSSVQSS